MSDEFRLKLWGFHNQKQKNLYYGYGWYTHTLDGNPEQVLYSEHGGGPSLGAYTLAARSHDGNDFVVLLTNTDRSEVDLNFLAEKIFQILDQE